MVDTRDIDGGMRSLVVNDAVPIEYSDGRVFVCGRSIGKLRLVDEFKVCFQLDRAVFRQARKALRLWSERDQ